MSLGTLGPWLSLPWLLRGRFHAERGTKKTEATTSPSTGHSAPKAEVSLRKTLQSHGSGVMSGGRQKKHKAENSESLIKELTSLAKECGEVQASWWSQKRRMLGKTDGRSWVDLEDRFIGDQRLNCRPTSGQRESGRLRWEKPRLSLAEAAYLQSLLWLSQAVSSSSRVSYSSKNTSY